MQLETWNTKAAKRFGSKLFPLTWKYYRCAAALPTPQTFGVTLTPLETQTVPISRVGTSAEHL